jgi:hypothetical protein
VAALSADRCGKVVSVTVAPRATLAVSKITNPSSPFRSPITDDDLMMLPHVASADRHALRAPSGNATKKFSK